MASLPSPVGPLAMLVTRISELQQSNEELKARNAALLHLDEELRARNDEQLRLNTNLKAQNSLLKQQTNKLQQQTKKLQQVRNGLELQNGQLHRLNQELTAQNDVMLGRGEIIKKRNAQLLCLSKELRVRNEVLNAECKSRNDTLMAEKDKFRSQNNDLINENEELIASRQVLQCENGKMKAEIRELQQQLQQRFTSEPVVDATEKNCTNAGQTSREDKPFTPTEVVVRGASIHGILTASGIPAAPVSSTISTNEDRMPSTPIEDVERAPLTDYAETASGMLHSIGEVMGVIKTSATIAAAPSPNGSSLKGLGTDASQVHERSGKRQRLSSPVHETTQQTRERESTAGIFTISTSGNLLIIPSASERCSCSESGEPFDEVDNWFLFETSFDSDTEENFATKTETFTGDAPSSIVPQASRGWNLPPDLTFAAFDERWPQSPRLSLKSFTELDAARPWDLIFCRRSKVSHVFNYRALGSRARTWVREILWFQFSFRRELWHWMYWIEMETRTEDTEWERYRQNREERISGMLQAWNTLEEQAANLIGDGKLARDVLLDMSIWFFYPERQLTWQYSTINLVREQALEDNWYPARCYYVHNLADHPFCQSNLSTKYPNEHKLPPLVSPSWMYKVQVVMVDAVLCPTSWGTIEIAPTFIAVPYHDAGIVLGIN